MTRKIVYLAAMIPLATSCTKSNYNLSTSERAMLTQVKESRVHNAPIAPAPKILPETHFAAGRMFEEQGQFGKAIDQYRKAVAVNHNFTAAYHRMGLLFSRLSHHEHALQALKKAVALEPNNARLRNNLGFELMFMERWSDAEAQLRKAIELDPRFARAHINLAMALCKQDRFEEALARFQTVLPEPDAYYNLGLLYRGQRRYDEASATFRHVLALNPGFNAARTQLEELAELQDEDFIDERPARTVQAPATAPASRTADRRADSARVPQHDGFETEPQTSRTTRPRVEESPSVRETQPIRDFTATNRLTDAHSGSDPATSATSTITRVSRVRGREAQPHPSIADQEPLFTGSVIPASNAKFNDPDCEPDTILTLRTQADRDRYRPTKSDNSGHLPRHVDSSADNAFSRGQSFSHAEVSPERHVQIAATAARTASTFVQPTTLRDYAALQRDQRGPEALAFIIAHDPSNRSPQSKPESKPMLVRDRPLQPRETRPPGKPRTDARGWPAFLDPTLLHTEFLRSLHEPAPRDSHAHAQTGDHTPGRNQHYDSWLMDFNGLHTLADAVASEFLCLADLNGHYHEQADDLWTGYDTWPGETLTVTQARLASSSHFTRDATLRSAAPDARDLACPADIFIDLNVGASVLMFPPDPVCEPGASDDEFDTVSIGDARKDTSHISPVSIGRMPPVRH